MQTISSPRPGPTTIGPTMIGSAGRALIRRFESCGRRGADGLFHAYPDPATGGAPWTIGWGATGPDIGPRTVWSHEQCDQRFEHDLVRYSRDVARALNGSPTSPNQFDALVSFHFNTGAIAKASLTRFHRAGEFARAAAEFSRWVYASGKILTGLVRRRAAEAKLYAAAGGITG